MPNWYDARKFTDEQNWQQQTRHSHWQRMFGMYGFLQQSPVGLVYLQDFPLPVSAPPSPPASDDESDSDELPTIPLVSAPALKSVASLQGEFEQATALNVVLTESLDLVETRIRRKFGLPAGFPPVSAPPSPPASDDESDSNELPMRPPVMTPALTRAASLISALAADTPASLEPAQAPARMPAFSGPSLTPVPSPSTVCCRP